MYSGYGCILGVYVCMLKWMQYSGNQDLKVGRRAWCGWSL